MDVWGLKEQNLGNEELVEEDNVYEEIFLVDPHIQPITTLVLIQFLKLQVVRVVAQSLIGTTNYLRLRKSS